MVTYLIQKYEEGTTNPIQGVMFLVTDSSGATVGPNQGEYATDRNGRIVLTGLTPGTTITAREIRTADGYVLDTTPQSVLVKAGETQTMTFYNKKDDGVEIIKLDGADKTKRLPNTTFEIRAVDGGFVKNVTTGRDGRIYASLDAGNYYNGFRGFWETNRGCPGYLRNWFGRRRILLRPNHIDIRLPLLRRNL